MDSVPPFEKDIDLRKKGIPIKDAVAKCRELEEFIDSNGKIDLGDPSALRAYNSCLFYLLKNLKITIPEGFLIPTAGLRIAVTDVIWEKTCSCVPDSSSPIKGVEVGLGATAVNSLLLAQKGATIIGTEVDKESLYWARKNIEQNNLQERITIVDSEGKILKNIGIPDDVMFAFTLPPYYEASASHLVYKDRGFQGRYSELVAGDSGLDFTLQFLKEAKDLKVPCVFVLLDSLQMARTAVSYVNDLGWKSSWCRLLAGTRKRYLVYGLPSP